VTIAGRATDELSAVPPKDFTRARNARAAALKAAGHPGEAAAVRRLTRPTATLWATNQLARVDPTRLARFVDVVQQLRRTQLRDPRATAEALRAQRTELEALVHRAKEIMARAGYRASPAHLRRIEDTLRGAAVDGRLAEDLTRGGLAAELAAPGFEILAGVAPARPLRIVRGDEAVGSARQRADETRVRLEAQRQQREQEAAAHRRQAQELAEASARAERDVRDLEQQLRAARERRRASRRTAAKAAAASRPPRRRRP